MIDQEHQRLLDHLHVQTTHLASLTAWAKENPTDRRVLLRVRDEIFTIRETLDTLSVPAALEDNAACVKDHENSPVVIMGIPHL